MSQEKLGEELGITFQQIQKYEKGTNRISASRLHEIARILEVPTPFFFESHPGQTKYPNNAPPDDYVADFLATADGLALIKAFMKVRTAKLRRSIVAVVEEIAATRG